ncbi:hypothetical protein GCM10020256_65600 [Streptomyces thermocoprophilus]
MPGIGPVDGPLTADAHHAARAAAFAAVSPQQRTEAQRAALARAASLGIGTIHECGGPEISSEDDFTGLLALAAEEPGPRVVGYWAEQNVERARELGAAGAAGDLFADGALGSHTACLHEPYADAAHTGTAYLDTHAVAAHVVACTEAGIQAGFHAIGDAAVTAVIDGVRAAAEKIGLARVRAARHRVEHAEMVTPETIAAFAELGLTASVQPAFDALWGGEDGMYAQRLGAERARTLNPFAALLRAGVPLAFGSDSPVTPSTRGAPSAPPPSTAPRSTGSRSAPPSRRTPAAAGAPPAATTRASWCPARPRTTPCGAPASWWCRPPTTAWPAGPPTPVPAPPACPTSAPARICRSVCAPSSAAGPCTYGRASDPRAGRRAARVVPRSRPPRAAPALTCGARAPVQVERLLTGDRPGPVGSAGPPQDARPATVRTRRAPPGQGARLGARAGEGGSGRSGRCDPGGARAFSRQRPRPIRSQRVPGRPEGHRAPHPPHPPPGHRTGRPAGPLAERGHGAGPRPRCRTSRPDCGRLSPLFPNRRLPYVRPVTSVRGAPTMVVPCVLT